MDHHLDSPRPIAVHSEQPAPTDTVPYERPQVEMVVSADDLEREVLYAGVPAYGIA